MKSSTRDFLSTDLQFIKGVGPVLAARLMDVLGGRRVIDFLLHRPSYVRSRDIANDISTATGGDTITVPLLIKSHKKGGCFRGRRRPTQIICDDKMGNRVLVQFFNSSYLDYWLKNYCKDNLKHRTIEEYSVIANKYLKRDLGHFRLNAITSYQLNKYMMETCRRYDYSYGYFNNFVKVIKTSFKIATDFYGFINYVINDCYSCNRTIFCYIKLF